MGINADFLFLEKAANFRNYCSFNKWSGDIMHGHVTELTLTLTMTKKCFHSFVQITPA
jgi:hypothetical protein